ncbi:MAG TPA: alkaline phosphatase family protein, partial [Opitutaceae bacterium]|nr:alkaline phosphatase family protein [Opitutaceae bacterium]
SAVSVTNAERVSYPGYNEILAGRADPVITSNTPIPNPNVTVLEWLHGRPGFSGRVAACAEWRVFTAIINVPRSRLPVWVTRQHSPPSQATPRLLEIEQWMEDIPTFTPDEHFDAFVYQAAVDRFDTLKPRVFLLAFGEPDSWAHQKRYDRYLYSIQRCDRFVRQLWEKLQADPEYRGRTTLILTPDHGRGVLADDWTSHGKKVPRCEETWLMALGPDTPALGERRNVPEAHQAQVAATMAALLGEDLGRAFPDAAPPVAEIVGPAAR